MVLGDFDIIRLSYGNKLAPHQGTTLHSRRRYLESLSSVDIANFVSCLRLFSGDTNEVSPLDRIVDQY